MNIVNSIINLIKENEDLINKYESRKLSSEKSSKSASQNPNNSIESIISSAKAKLIASNSNKKFKLKNKKSSNEKEKTDELDSVWVEDKDTSLDTKSVKNEEILFKNRINQKEKNIMNHLYKPFFDKTTYLRQLNMLFYRKKVYINDS